MASSLQCVNALGGWEPGLAVPLVLMNVRKDVGAVTHMLEYKEIALGVPAKLGLREHPLNLTRFVPVEESATGMRELPNPLCGRIDGSPVSGNDPNVAAVNHGARCRHNSPFTLQQMIQDFSSGARSLRRSTAGSM